jgi:hypothetical protein
LSQLTYNSRKDNTVIIFDWDDTLLCSSAINLQQWTQTQMSSLEMAIEVILTTSMDLGSTLIVTNGNKSWVQDSSRRFVPKLTPLLNRLTVMSARAAYEQTFPGEPFAWKRAAFHDILTARQEALPDGMNLVVLGDSFAEIEAARYGTAHLHIPAVVKTVKFKEMPSVNELLGEVRAVTQVLPELVNEEKSIDKMLTMRPLPGNMGYLTSWASGWNVTDAGTESSVISTYSSANLGCPAESKSPVTLAGG